MEGNILEERVEFNKRIDFFTGEVLGWKIDVMEGECSAFRFSLTKVK
jgi:hypothetical protein